MIWVIFLLKSFFGDEGFQNAYQPTLSALELKEDNGTDYVADWKSKGVYTSKLKPFYTAVFHSIKLFGYRNQKTIR